MNPLSFRRVAAAVTPPVALLTRLRPGAKSQARRITQLGSAASASSCWITATTAPQTRDQIHVRKKKFNPSVKEKRLRDSKM